MELAGPGTTTLPSFLKTYICRLSSVLHITLTQAILSTESPPLPSQLSSATVNDEVQSGLVGHRRLGDTDCDRRLAGQGW